MRQFISNTIIDKLKRLSAKSLGYLWLSEKHNSSIILLYHSIGERCNNDYLKLRISPESFEAQMAYLYKKKYEVVPLGELINNLDSTSPLSPPYNGGEDGGTVVSITFDDGYLDNLNLAIPILKKYGFSAALFVATDYLNGKGDKNDYWEKWGYLTPEKLKKLTSMGIEIGSHSCSHKVLISLDNTGMRNEILFSRKILEDITQKKINLFSYPHGIFNEKIKDILIKEGYVAACTSITGFNNSKSDLYELRRIEIRTDDSLEDFKDKLKGYYNWLGYFQRTRLKWEGIKNTKGSL